MTAAVQCWTIFYKFKGRAKASFCVCVCVLNSSVSQGWKSILYQQGCLRIFSLERRVESEIWTSSLMTGDSTGSWHLVKNTNKTTETCLQLWKDLLRFILYLEELYLCVCYLGWRKLLDAAEQKKSAGCNAGKGSLSNLPRCWIICRKFSDMGTNCELQITCCGHKFGEDY